MNHAEAAKTFHDAIAVLDLQKALEAAQWLKETAGGDLYLKDSLALVLLMIWQGDYRSEKAGERWIEGLVRSGASDSEVQIATAALEGMKDPDSRFCCEKVLRILCNGPGHL